MGTVTVTGAMIIIIGWITLVEFDSYSEEQRAKILDNIKSSPAYIMLIALMPIGIFINILGSISTLSWLVSLGTFLILLQGIIIVFILWNRKRWKSILLLIALIMLGSVILIPLFIS